MVIKNVQWYTSVDIEYLLIKMIEYQKEKKEKLCNDLWLWYEQFKNVQREIYLPAYIVQSWNVTTSNV